MFKKMMARKPKVESLKKMKKPMRWKTKANTNKENKNQTTTFVPSTCYPLDYSSQFTTRCN